MKEQGDLFDPRNLARESDPQTSHEAAASIVPVLGGLRKRVLEIVTRHPGRTARALSNLSGDGDPRTINRRLGELERMGLIKRGDPIGCVVTGRRCAVWEPV